MGEEQAVEANVSDLDRIILSAEVHGRDGDDPDHEVGDLQDALRMAWARLTPSARRIVAREFFALHGGDDASGAGPTVTGAAARCVACGEDMNAGHEVHLRNRDFCSLECADVPQADWVIDRFAEPLARYPGKFSIWPDGTLQGPEGRYDLDADGRDEARDAADELLSEHAPDGPCGPECDSGGGPCRGWAVFNSGVRGPEVERIDDCGRFETDDEAIGAALTFFDDLLNVRSSLTSKGRRTKR